VTLPRVSNATKIAGALLLAVAAFFGGRFSAPVKTVETVKIEWLEHTRFDVQERIVTVEAKHKRTEETRAVDGSVTIVTTEDTDTRAAHDVSTLALTWASGRQEQEKVTERARPGWRLSLGAGWSDLQARPDLYRLELSRRLVGTVWLGAWAGTDKTGGVSLAAEW
jgi:hypothetical protein